MNRIATIGLAAIVITALGLASSTLAESQSTDPADAVSVDTDQLPVGEDRQAEFRTAVQAVHDQYTGSQTASSSGSGPTTSSTQADDDTGSGGDGGEDRQLGGSGATESTQPSGTRISKTDWLSVVLGLGAVGIAGGLIRYRERIRQTIVSDRSADETRAVQPAPDTEIERAWITLLEHAGITHPRTRTPQDCCHVAIETGYDSAVVNQLCRAFEDTQYGDTDPTTDQQQLARETLDRLGDEIG